MGLAAKQLDNVVKGLTGMKIFVEVKPIDVNVNLTGANGLAGVQPGVKDFIVSTVNTALRKNFNSVTGEPADGIEGVA